MAETQQPTIWGLGITFSIISIAAVVLRFKARKIQGQKLGPDDWTILISLILTLAQTADILVATQLGGLGTHSKLTSDGKSQNPQADVVFGKTGYVLEIITWPTVGITKISILLMYKRIFATRKFITMTWVLIGVVVAWTLSFTLAFTFSCIPIQSQWDHSIEYSCINVVALFTTALVTDVVTDFLILILPIYKVWGLQMALGRKVPLIGIFLLGLLVSVVGLIRIRYLTLVWAIPPDSTNQDVTWHYAPVWYWAIVEAHVGVLSACLPILRPIQTRAASYLSFNKLSFFLLSRDKGSDIPLDTSKGNFASSSNDSHWKVSDPNW
ncbi:hypothetical protein F4777DRAFT_534454 [Nemania sp. FL0916]|nr:hypothetical protein F4777DRAFT_534454 [Nemania sp. FL0916]